MFRTITAKYAGICKRCDGPIAVGQKIRYGGYGRTYHLKADCSAAALDLDAPTDDATPDQDAAIVLNIPTPIAPLAGARIDDAPIAAPQHTTTPAATVPAYDF